MIVEELVAKLGLEFDDTELKKFEEKMAGLGSTVKSFSFALAGAAGSIFAIAKFTSNAGDEALKMSQRLGVNIEALQELGYAAKLADIEHGELAQSIGLLNKNVTEAMSGNSELAGAFKKVGISVAQFRGKAPDAISLIGQMSDHFKTMPDGAEKSALAMKVFGKSGAKMIPLLNEGGAGLAKMGLEARRMGLVFDKESVEAMERFNDQITRVKSAVTGIAYSVGKRLVPIIEKLTNKFLAWLDANRSSVIQRTEFFFKALAVFVENAWNMLDGLTKSAMGFIDVMGGIEKVTKMVIGFASAWYAAKMLIGIGRVIQAIKALRFAMITAQLAALAVPLAIGAAFVALGLIIEDLYLTLTDPNADTFFRDLINMAPKALDFIKGLFGDFANWIMSKVASIGPMLGNLLMAGLKASPLGMLFYMAGGGSGDMSGLSSVGGMLGMTPATAPSAGTTMNSMSNGGANVNAPINITVGGDLDPAAVPKIQSSMDGSIDRITRSAARRYQGAPTQ